MKCNWKIAVIYSKQNMQRMIIGFQGSQTSLLLNFSSASSPLSFDSSCNFCHGYCTIILLTCSLALYKLHFDINYFNGNHGSCTTPIAEFSFVSDSSCTLCVLGEIASLVSLMRVRHLPIRRQNWLCGYKSNNCKKQIIELRKLWLWEKLVSRRNHWRVAFK